MRVVFLQDVANVADAGDVREVRRGYAKNYLLPRELAVAATANELNRIEALKRAAGHRRLRDADEMEALAERVAGMVLTILQRAGPTGRLYGSVTTGMIAEELSRVVGFTLDRRSLELAESIREVGQYEVTVRLGPQITAPVQVVVTTDQALRQGEVTREIATADAEAGLAGEPREAEEEEEAAAVDEVVELETADETSEAEEEEAAAVDEVVELETADETLEEEEAAVDEVMDLETADETSEAEEEAAAMDEVVELETADETSEAEEEEEAAAVDEVVELETADETSEAAEEETKQ